MQVSDVMQTDLVTIAPGASLSEALEAMLSHKVRHLLVVQGTALFGVITDRDLRFAMPSRIAPINPEDREAFLDKTNVERICIKQPHTVRSDYGFREAVLLMRKHHIGCLPVVDDGRLVGILTVTDLIDGFLRITEPGGKA